MNLVIVLLKTCISITPFYFQKRHRADGETNKREVEVLRDGNWEWVQWQSILVGDIVKVHNNNFFPADLLVLSSRLASNVNGNNTSKTIKNIYIYIFNVVYL